MSTDLRLFGTAPEKNLHVGTGDERETKIKETGRRVKGTREVAK